MRKSAPVLKISAILLSCIPVTAGTPTQRIESSVTEKVDLKPGATVQVKDSTGELNVVGRDEPGVEITTASYTWSDDIPAHREKAAAGLKATQAKMEVAANGDLVITVLRKRSDDKHLEMTLFVPRGTNLVIHHRIGDVSVLGVGGNVDASTATGDILLQLPEPAQYSISADCGFGFVYSDFTGSSKRTTYGGERFRGETDGAAARKLNLHARIGAISIQKMEDRPAPAAGL